MKLTLPTLFLSTATVGAMVIAWNANEEPNISHYLVYQGTNSRSYQRCLNAGNQTNLLIPNASLFPGINYFTVTAVDSNGLESAYSTELTYSLSNGPGTNLSIWTATLCLEYTTNLTGPWTTIGAWGASITNGPKGFFRGVVHITP